MILLTVDCDEQSSFYAVADTDELFFYCDEARNGSTGWAFGGAARQIGPGWQNIHQIICGGDGVIYVVDVDAKKMGDCCTSRTSPEPASRGVTGRRGQRRPCGGFAC